MWITQKIYIGYRDYKSNEVKLISNWETLQKCNKNPSKFSSISKMI